MAPVSETYSLLELNKKNCKQKNNSHMCFGEKQNEINQEIQKSNKRGG